MFMGCYVELDASAVAALGFLWRVVAGAAMALSSVSVMANALLLKRWRMGGG